MIQTVFITQDIEFQTPETLYGTHQGFFYIQGPKFGPIPNQIKVTFFPNFEKNHVLIFFLFEDWDFHSVTTHTSYMMTIYYHCILFLLQYFDGKSMCNS